MELLMIMTFALFTSVSSSSDIPASAGEAYKVGSLPTPSVAMRPQGSQPVARSTSTVKPANSKPAITQAALNPGLFKASAATAKAPAEFVVVAKTTKGEFQIKVVRKWSPRGADRFYNLVQLGYYSDVGFFRVIPNFMAQFGIHGNSKVNDAWRHYIIEDDELTPATQSNVRGMVTFAKGALPDSRCTQLFINFKDNQALDNQGFTPVGQVVKGMDIVDSIFKTGENPYRLQRELESKGNAALKARYPQADFIKSMTIMPAKLR